MAGGGGLATLYHIYRVCLVSGKQRTPKKQAKNQKGELILGDGVVYFLQSELAIFLFTRPRLGRWPGGACALHTAAAAFPKPGPSLRGPSGEPSGDGRGNQNETIRAGPTAGVEVPMVLSTDRPGVRQFGVPAFGAETKIPKQLTSLLLVWAC